MCGEEHQVCGGESPGAVLLNSECAHRLPGCLVNMQSRLGSRKAVDLASPWVMRVHAPHSGQAPKVISSKQGVGTKCCRNSKEGGKEAFIEEVAFWLVAGIFYIYK